MTTAEIEVHPDQLAFDPAPPLAKAGMDDALGAERVMPWREAAETWIRSQAAGSELTADDLAAAVGLPSEGVYRNNAVGGLFGALAKAGAIEWTGHFRRSERAIGRGNLQRVWRRT